MSSSGDPLRMLNRARRRWFAWRVVETAALCAGATAALGVMLLPLAWWGHFDATQLAGWLLGIGVATGGSIGLLRRPGLMQTAIEIDRQLDLHDLFSTAISSPAFVDEQFGSVVRAQAEAVSRSGAVNELILRRLGARVWGGIGLTTALLLTLALMMSQPGSTPALAGAERNAASTASSASSAAHDPARAAPRPGQSTASARRDQTRDGAIAERDASGEGADSPSAGASRNATADGAGATAGRTDAARVDPIASTAGDSGNRDGSASGAGGTGTTPDGVGAASGATSASASPQRTPPWRSPSWASDRDAALRQLDAGHIPDSYRGLVRDYFDRETAR